MSDAIVKNLNFGLDAKDKVFKGIEKLTKAVSSTLGASGKCVILEDDTGRPLITKDGVTVANSIILLDPVENMGATLLKEAARQTVQEAGDGTTTATVLAHALLKQAYKEDVNARDLKNGINIGVEKVVKYLEDNSIPVKEDMIDQVATISANNDHEIGKVIADAFRSVDTTGVVMMEINDQPETKSEIVNGIQYAKGYNNLSFITDKTSKTCELENPVVLIIESLISNVRKIQSVLEYVIKNKRSLLIIGDAEQQVLNTLAMNKMKGNIKVNIIDAPTYGVSRKEVMQDLAMLTGATLINEIDEPSEEVKTVIADLKDKIKNASSPAFKNKFEKRLAILSAKVAVVKVGANSEVELKEKRDRVEDAICATKAAIQNGIVPGGGIALFNGEEMLYEAIKAPFRTILDNAGINEPEMPKTKGRGLNVVTGNMVNMIKSGIIDPLLVTKSALLNAASVATTILSTDCVINNLRVDEGSR